MRKVCVLFISAIIIVLCVPCRLFLQREKPDMRTDSLDMRMNALDTSMNASLDMSMDNTDMRMNALDMRTNTLDMRMNAEKSTASAGEGGKVALPAIMYHSVNSGGVGNYVVHPNELEKDFRNILRLGYTPIFAREVADFIDGKGEIPEKPVLITFDDGFYNNYTYVLPLLKKYGFKATIAVVGSFTERERGQRQSNYYSNLNKEQIGELYKSGLVEIANHTYDLHSVKNGRKGATRKRGEDFGTYEGVFVRDYEKNQAIIEAVTGEKPRTFVYPYGAYSESTVKILKERGCGIALTCNERVSVISRGCESMTVGRFNRSGKVDSDGFFAKIERKTKESLSEGKKP